MPYTAEISRANPTCFLFLIDRSGSMADPFGNSETGGSKADEAAVAINRLLSELIIKCAKDQEIRRYFQVGVIGYGASVGPVLGGSLSGQDLVWIDDLYAAPLRVEERIKKVPDGAGGLVETTVKFPVWFDPVADNGTPMTAAFKRAFSILQHWVTSNNSSFPPIVINITDGESTDGDPSQVARALQALTTSDGNTLVFNVHLSSTRAAPIAFPDDEGSLPDQYARLLFGISSQLPDFMRETARQYGYSPAANSRGFVFNAGIEDLISFLIIGTQPKNLR